MLLVLAVTGQLDLIARPPERTGQLLAVVLDGQPQRAKHACQCLAKGKRRKIDGAWWVPLDRILPSTRPEEKWKEWRDESVASLLELKAELDLPRLRVPVLARVTAVFRRPQGKKTTHTLDGVEEAYPYEWVPERVPFVGKPDHDQVWKAALDVCVQAQLLVDDRLVVGDKGSRRWYAAEGEDPCVEVRLWRA